MCDGEKVKRAIGYWKGILAGIEVGQNVDVAELFVRLSPEMQGMALELLKAHPLVWHITNWQMDIMVKPLIKEFIATLNWVQQEEA